MVSVPNCTLNMLVKSRQEHNTIDCRVSRLEQSVTTVTTSVEFYYFDHLENCNNLTDCRFMALMMLGVFKKVTKLIKFYKFD